MAGLRTLTITGGVIAAVSGLIAVAGIILMFAGGFDGGANIGAGLLLLLSMLGAVVGGAVLAVAGILHLVTRRRPRTTSA
ncbi:hypothetical protein [Curtobacterium sp. MCSS17_016]|uniref:hypothetical protein n=1 Tax=Curtobacterium sp. MCSS17_016 TaxID=2175644 RepID=UPI000DA81FA2|nr:hypothetical protein [Curtobacterium sp. MCSS17_016]WIE81449.1 hypothetical protein DEJ19_019630 [Curtobacterium sp. MCSS17_016]